MSESHDEPSPSENPPEKGGFEITDEMRRRNRKTVAIILGAVFIYLAIGFYRAVVG
jgi:hypothetical protein